MFVDSEFFHGKDWKTQKNHVKTNTEFWQKKIERNRQRDVEVNEKLREQGWTVIRFWSGEIENNLEDCIAKIQREIDLKQQ